MAAHTLSGPQQITGALWDDVLLLLAVMMLADGRVVEAERDAFARAVESLRERLEPDEAALPAGAVAAWYGAHAHRARDLALREDFDMAVLPLLGRLRGLADTQALLDALGRVADADLHRAPCERDVITLASAYWGLVRPTRHFAGAPAA